MGVLQTPALLLGYGTEEAISIGNGQRKANVVEKESLESSDSLESYLLLVTGSENLTELMISIISFCNVSLIETGVSAVTV